VKRLLLGLSPERHVFQWSRRICGCFFEEKRGRDDRNQEPSMPGADWNFPVIKEAKLEFAGITVLIGPQARGKSWLSKPVAHRKVAGMIVGIRGKRCFKSNSADPHDRAHPGTLRICGRETCGSGRAREGSSFQPPARFESGQREFRKIFQLKPLIQAQNRNFEFGEFLLPREQRIHD
jgi:hypothetical protein